MQRYVIALAGLLAIAASPAAARDWTFFRPGFASLIDLHCRAKWVVHPEEAIPCIESQTASMLLWTATMTHPRSAPELVAALQSCRARWSALPHTNWVAAIACTERALGR